MKIVMDMNNTDSSFISGLGQKYDSINELVRHYTNIPNIMDKKWLEAAIESFSMALQSHMNYELNTAKILIMPITDDYGIGVEIVVEIELNDEIYDMRFVSDTIRRIIYLSIDDETYYPLPHQIRKIFEKLKG